MLGNVAGVLSRLAQLLFVATSFSQEEQGLFFTFFSILQFVLLFDLGFSTVTLNRASHITAHLSTRPDGALEGHPDTISSLASLLRRIIRWYCVAALLAGAILAPIGLGVLFWSPDPMPASCYYSWLLSVLAGVGQLPLLGLSQFTSGCGRPTAAAAASAIQGILSGLVFAISASLGAGLFSMAAASGLGSLAAFGMLTLPRRQMFVGLLSVRAPCSAAAHSPGHAEFAIKSAISYASGAATYHCITPVCMLLLGATEAGRIGMTISTTLFLQGIAITIVQARAPCFGVHVALKRWREMEREFFNAAFWALLFGCVCSAAIQCCAMWATRWSTIGDFAAIRSRFLSDWHLFWILLSSMLNLWGSMLAIYLRSFLREPFAVVSVLGAIAMNLSLLYFGRIGSLDGVVASYCIVTGTIGGPIDTWLFRRCRRDWESTEERVA